MRLRAFGGLWVENTRPGFEAGPRPRPLALLALLAVAAARGMSRERALGILWPESEPERARHALSQTIYSLRRELGTEVVLSTPDLRLDTRVITSDVDEFRAAIAAKNWGDAAALYVGPFLDGFYLADAPEFERWVEEQRASFSSDGMRAIETLARERIGDGRPQDAVELARRLTRLDPVNARFATSYMECLAGVGDRSGAMAHGKAYTELLRREFDAGPDRAVETLMARLRDTTDPIVARGPVAQARTQDAPVADTPDAASPEAGIESPAVAVDARAANPIERAPGNRRRAMMIVAAVVAVAGGALGWRAVAAARAPERPVLAVGLIRDLVAPDSAGLSGVLSEMLATSLARLPELQVIANSRMLELTSRDGDPTRGALTDAARRAGASEVLEGELIPRPDRSLRLDLRRVDIASGRVRDAYQIVGSERIGLLDSATTLIAGGLRVGAPGGSLAEVSTRSPIAYRLYEEGLRAFHQFDVFAANRLFRAAVQEDSTFAMAVYYAWRSAAAAGDSAQGPLADRAMALSSRAPERDRWLILAHVGFARDDPRTLAAAETLATRYADHPEALIRAAEVIPDPGRAAVLLDRAIAIDSAAAVSPAAVCRVCDAFSLLVRRYRWADSGAAVERTLARWTTLRPDDAMPWRLRADWLIGAGRRTDAEAAQARYESMGGERGDAAERALVWSLRSDDYESANALCDVGLANRDTLRFVTWRRLCAIALRAQGRYREALALVREGRAPRSGLARRDVPGDPQHAAILDLEMGRPRIAADAFLALSRETESPGGLAWRSELRRRTWFLALAATAAVAVDTTQTRMLADSVETTGRGRLLGQEALLHHFVRGLLFSRAGQPRAAVREFRAALSSPTEGYSRINYELSRSLLALSRAEEGIPILRAVLHGPVDGPNLLLTRTEVHALLARLFEAVGARDSAAAHVAVVERAWRAGDAPLRARSDSARAWLIRAGRVHR